MELVNKKELLAEIDEAISNVAFSSPYQNNIAEMISGMERVRDIVADALAEPQVLSGYCTICKHHIALRLEKEQW